MRRPTSFDIAALAGVSQATVSRALNASSSVSDIMRQRVLAAAKQLHYTVNINASKLRSRRLNTIALLVSQDLDHPDNRINPFFLPLIASILDYASSKGVDVLISLQKAEADWGADYGTSRRAEGIIFLGYRDFDSYLARVTDLKEAGTPWVVFGPVMPLTPALFVGSDNEAGAFEAVSHLLRLGRKRIAFLGEASPNYSEFFERFKGFERAHLEAGVTPDPALVINCFISLEDGATAMDRLLEQGLRFDAIFAVTDLLAIGAMQSLQRAGLRVPEDVSVVGFDDLWVSASVNPPLTTVRQDTRAAATILFDTLASLVAGQPVSARRIPAKLIVRQSCGAGKS